MSSGVTKVLIARKPIGQTVYIPPDLIVVNDALDDAEALALAAATMSRCMRLTPAQVQEMYAFGFMPAGTSVTKAAATSAEEDGYEASLAKVRATVRLFTEASERDLEELAEYGSNGAGVIEDAIHYGLTLKEAMTWPNGRELAGGMRRAYEAGVNPEGWLLSRVERLNADGKRAVAWVAEEADGRARHRERIEVSDQGDIDTVSPEAPPVIILMRALDAALKPIVEQSLLDAMAETDALVAAINEQVAHQ